MAEVVPEIELEIRRARRDQPILAAAVGYLAEHPEAGYYSNLLDELFAEIDLEDGMTPVQSGHIKAIGYDPASKTMTTHFVDGGKYEHYDVSPEKHAAVMGSGKPDHSVGKAFHAQIIKGGHKSKKLDE